MMEIVSHAIRAGLISRFLSAGRGVEIQVFAGFVIPVMLPAL